jgi:predicted enzyme related to lactoylglutathione lyase
MIIGVHALLYSRDAQRVRAFFRDALELKSVDSGDGWLIFALPPTELAVHPTHTEHGPELYLMCDDIERTLAELEKHGVTRTRPVTNQGWGLVTSLKIPGGLEMGIYEPRHATAISTSPKRAPRKKAKPAAKKKSRRR